MVIKKWAENAIREWKERDDFEKYAVITYIVLVLAIVFISLKSQSETLSNLFKALPIVFLSLMFNRIKKTKKQVVEKNKEIESQKHLIEEHQKEIIDSITYAKRIQDAIIPSEEFIKTTFPNSFVLYKPKDIVAGDFYWMEKIGDTVFIAAADCTGHGVPGAMVSVVCSNALNRAVKEFGISDTGAILDKATDLVIETFEKSSSIIQDGMDISLLAVNKQNGQILWSGANNPLWYHAEGVLKEIQADKQPIGMNSHRKSFTTHSIAYQQGTTFYLFTDGFADQFGGPKGKKLKSRQLKETIEGTINKDLNLQQTYLSGLFESWKGNLEQVDDVCIIGIRL